MIRSDLAFPTATLGRPISAEKTTPHIVLKGRAADHSNAELKTVYAKLLQPTGKSIESACAWLARYLDLPIPTPVFVTVTKAKLPRETAWPFLSTEAVCFASTEIPLARPVTRWDEGAVASKLAGWPKLIAAAIFDHLIANDDRSDDNLLLDPHGYFWLIDHGRALGGAGERLFSAGLLPSWMISGARGGALAGLLPK